MTPSHLPSMMMAMKTGKPGGPEEFYAATLPLPAIGAEDVLIKVEAAGVNRPDILQRRGDYPPPPGASDIIGLEVSGTIVAIGNEAKRWQVGDSVMALVSGGGYAEYCAAPEAQCLPVPSALNMIEAACVPETFFTVWTNVFERGRLRKGETLLIHGGTSGIGTTAIQLAKRFGARVIATAGSEEKCEKCRALGADLAINYRQSDFVEIIATKTQGKGVDLILDMVGGEYLARNLKSLKIDGRLVVIAVQGGARTEINLAELMVKRQTVTGSTLRPRSIAEKGAIAQAIEYHVFPWLAEGSVKPVIFKTFPLKEAEKAHRLMESGAHMGKIVLLT